MTPQQYIDAARVPRTLQPQSWADWYIERKPAPADAVMKRIGLEPVGYPDYTLLRRYTDATLMRGGTVVMEDSVGELKKHLTIWTKAKGRVLVTGLGLGCVVRGLLAKPQVEHIDVIEIDAGIMERVGPEFAGNPRVSLHHGDALSAYMPAALRWDYAWHDLWCEEDKQLLGLHLRLFARFKDRVPRQGAWNFPAQIRRYIRKHHRGGPVQIL